MKGIALTGFSIILFLQSIIGQTTGLSIDSLAANIEKAFSDSSTGWAYQIWKGQNLIRSNSGGFRIAAVDANDQKAVPFDLYHRMHIASISKSITAIATTRILQSKNIRWEDKIARFLPRNWSVHPSLKKTSFMDLLEMKSGLKAENDAETSSYFALKKLVEEGVNTNDIGKFNYQNVSYGLLRVLIANLNGFGGQMGTYDSAIVETLSSNSYIDYLNKNIFEKCGLATVYCRETTARPTLIYPFPYYQQAGLISGFSGIEGSNGDLSNYAGGLGWYLSVNDIGKIFTKFFFTDSLLDKPAKENLLAKSFPFASTRLRSGELVAGMGMWIMTRPGSKYNCGLNTVYMLLPDDILVVAFVNSVGRGIRNVRQRVLTSYNKSIN